MHTFKNNPEEVKRLKALLSYRLLDSLPEKDFDDITWLASTICETPVALVTLLDHRRQWFKSCVGLDTTETPRSISFCTHAIENPEEMMIVEDARKDERFKDNPLVTGDIQVIFYAGMPLVTPEGYAMGTLCVIDNKPRRLSAKQRESLKALAGQVVAQMELRKKIVLLEEQRKKLEEANEELERFSYVISHDLKSPLNNISALASLLEEDHKTELDSEGASILDHLVKAAFSARHLAEDVLGFARSMHATGHCHEEVNLYLLLEQVREMLPASDDCELRVDVPRELIIFSDRMALERILLNLLDNAAKYNDKPAGLIEVFYSREGENHLITISDNGPGIEKARQSLIFEAFRTLDRLDRYQQKGTGIGLYTVKKLTEKIGGRIALESEKGKGSKFTIVLPAV